MTHSSLRVDGMDSYLYVHLLLHEVLRVVGMIGVVLLWVMMATGS